MNKVIFKNFYRYVPLFKDRWTPIYLERGILDQDNYSLRWIDKEGTLYIPVSMISCILIGPGSNVTHAAIVTCSRNNVPIVWVGEDGLYFYSFGVSVNNKCKTSMIHAKFATNDELKNKIARKMFLLRFPDANVDSKTIAELKGMEGIRIKSAYNIFANKYNIEWLYRNSDGFNGMPIDELNKSLNMLNYNLYCLCLSAILTLGYIPSLGFVHSDGKIPFVYDIADLYKVNTSMDAAFYTYSVTKSFNKDLLLQNFVINATKYKLMQRIPKDLEDLFI